MPGELQPASQRDAYNRQSLRVLDFISSCNRLKQLQILENKVASEDSPEGKMHG